MEILIICLIIFAILLFVIVPIGFFQARKVFREQKNYERGLKMVPLLIHLPPLSDDTEANGRDSRDLIEENISKAQIMYDIIASTWQKGFWHTFYGQRHISFEIVGSKGFVNFYVAVPVSLVEVIKQAVVSAYPTARLEEVAEHNIFSPVGKISATMGGEMTLKKEFAYPIATYQDLKRDAIQSLLNALSTLDKEDGAGIQILIRPADPGWTKSARSIASHKRKGKDDKKGTALAGSWAKQLAYAPVKPPEAKKEGGGSDKPDLSSLDQAILDSIDDKTRHAGFEVMIRVVASSNISQRAQALLANIIATFSLYDSPGKNGFKYTPAKDIEKFVTGYILRFFPQENNRNILNGVELSTLFHFPDQENIPTSQLERQQSKQVDGPRNMPEDGLLLGYNVFRSAKKAIRLSDEDRARHMYAVGQTGTGKSTFLENLALQDMINGNGFAFIDPHGDTAEKLLAMVPKERTEDVIYFCPADVDYPLGLNIFEADNEDQKDFLIQEAINMLEKLYDPHNQGIIGPRYHHLFRNAALTVMADPEGGTFVDIPKLFRDPQYVKQKLKYVTKTDVLEFWQKEMPSAQRSNEYGEVVSWFVSKFGAFLSNSMMRNIIGQTKSAFNLREIMDNKKILIVNLSKGRTGDLNSKLLGMIFVMKFQAAAMSRASIPEDDRVPFCLYVDEFQNFSTDSFATILSEARKYRFNLIVANQFTTQLSEEIRDAVFGNIGTIVSYRIGQNDVESLARYFKPIFDADDLLRVPNFNSIVRTLVHGVPTQPFSMVSLPPLGNPNPKLGDALKQLSAAKYGRPRAIVDQEITERMKTIEPPKPAFGAGASPFGQGQPGMAGAPGAAAMPGGMGPAPAPAPKPTGTGNFLDEWLAKRRTPSSAKPGMPAQSPTGPMPAASAVSSSVPATNPLMSPAQPFAAPVAPVPPPVAPMGAQPQVSPPNTNNGMATTPSPFQSTASAAAPTAVGASPQPSPQLKPQPPVEPVADRTQPVIPSMKEAVKRVDKKQVEVSLRSDGADQTNVEDTIYIDRDGNFKSTTD